MWKIRWTWRLSLRRCRTYLKENLVLIKVLFFTLCYNVHVDKYYVADTAMEPLFWVVDHFTKFFGPVFVFVVCVLTASVVLIAYVIGIPHWWQRSPLFLGVLMIIGHWLLINIVFHYYMAATTQPGYLPEDILIPEAVSICKKCISPKPPRAHHCSICNKCILKMDHHCPWLNNCIGHYNHRYFYLYMVYMVIGVLFLMIFGYDLLYDHLWPKQDTVEISDDAMADIEVAKYADPEGDLVTWMKGQYWYHMSLVFVGLLCVGVFIALGALTAWHTWLISHGETSVEDLINRSEAKRLRAEGKVHINPYDFGMKENWRMFLGLQHGRGWRHILWPSTHPPIGNGLQWPTTWRP